MKKSLLVIYLFLTVGLLISDVFNPDIYLPGFAPRQYNEVKYYRGTTHVNFYSSNLLLMKDLNYKTKKNLDMKNNRIQLNFRIKHHDRQLYPPVYLTLEQYLDNSFRSHFRKKLHENVQDLLREDESQRTGGLIKDIVIDLPKIAQTRLSKKIFGGTQAARLSLNGSQKLTLSGSSTVRDRQNLSEGTQRQDFDLHMRQDLNLTLNGTIGKKIHVDVTHRSSSEDGSISNPNEVNISYQGLEDEIIKSIEGGNIALSLSGSKFFSYSASSEGLFGIKSEMKAGNLSVTTILGKDEAQKDVQEYKGQSQTQTQEIRSDDFVDYTHYFIADPTELFNLYTQDNIPASDTIYGNWVGNGIQTDEKGRWEIKNSSLLPAEDGTFKVYLDNGDATDNDGQGVIPGVGLDDTTETYYFKEQIVDQDFYIDKDSGLLTMNKAISDIYTLGIVYTNSDSVEIGDSSFDPNVEDDRIEVKLLRKRNQTDVDETWNLQCRNIYSLGMTDIIPEGFELNVYDIANTDNTQDDYIQGTNIKYYEYLQLDRNNDDIVNGDDEGVDLKSGYVILPFLRPFEGLGDGEIYNYDIDNDEEQIIYISVKGNIGTSVISLNAMNILEGSVSVTVNGDELKENRDYMVDYSIGIVTLLSEKAKSSSADIKIRYEYKPIFTLQNKTIIGTRADMEFTDQVNLGGTVIYQSEKVAEDRPKIGSENRSIFLADLDGHVEIDTPFLTKVIDWLPLIETDSESKMTLEGEVAMSMPRRFGNPDQHDPKEAYVDDMEAILQTFSLGISRSSWKPGSKPRNNTMGDADIIWYNLDEWYKEEVFDDSNIPDDEKDEKISVLTLKMTPDSINTDKYEAGLMRYIGNEIDLSEKKFIETLVKLDSTSINQNVTMHIDLGKVISEDFYTKYGGEGFLNTEDGYDPADSATHGIYEDEGTQDGKLDSDEDVGLDRLPDSEEEGYDANDNPDPSADNWDNNRVNYEYPKINRTQGNGNLDTEDLNSNGRLDTLDTYFEYSINLTENSDFFVSETEDGFQFFRIPMQESGLADTITYNEEILPDLDRISYARVWFEFEDETKVHIVSLDLVGNKWKEKRIRDENDNIINENELEMNQESISVEIIDNQKDQHYVQPDKTILEGEEDQLERSMYIKYENLQEGHLGLATRDIRDPNSQSRGLDLMSYNKIRFLVYPEYAQDNSNDTQMQLFIRLGADSLNYYEIRYDSLAIEPYSSKMNENSWHDLEIEFSDLTKLKIHDSTYTDSINNITYKKVNQPDQNPTLTNIKIITVGMRALQDNFNGRIYFNDIRVADPYEEIGFAARSSFHTKFADFANLDISLNWRTPNFQTSASRDASASLNRRTAIDIRNNYNLDKFFPATWGMKIPLNLNWSKSKSIPRFKANSDILRKDLDEETKEKQKIESSSRKVSISIDQNKTPSSKILEYTIKNSSLDLSYEENTNLASTNRDTTYKISGNYDYNLNIPKESIDLSIWKDYKFYFFPSKFNNSFTYNHERPKKWDYITTTDSSYWEPASQSKEKKTFRSSNTIGYDIFSDLSSQYKLETNRDLLLEGEWKNIQIGKEKNRTQTIDFDYSPNYLKNIFSYDTHLDIVYSDDHKKPGSSDTLYYSGDVSRDIGLNFTFKNKTLLNNLISSLSKDKEEGNEREQEQEQEEQRQEQNQNNYEEPGLIDLNEVPEDSTETEEKENENENDNQQRSQYSETNRQQQEEEESQEQTNQPEGKSPNLFISTLRFLTKLNNINISIQNNYSTNYDNRLKRPDILYQLGFPNILAEAEIQSKTLSEKYSLNSDLQILANLSASFSLSRNYIKDYGDVNQLKINTTLPNLGLELREFEKIIGIEKILESSWLSSSFSRIITQTGDIDWDKPTTDKTQLSFTPLVKWNGNWIHDVKTNISISYDRNENVSYSGTKQVNLEENRRINSHIEWSFSAPTGIKLPLLKRFRFKNELTASLDFELENKYSTSEDEISGSTLNRDALNYKVTPGASYKFNDNITAGLNSTYENNHDRKEDKQTKIFSLSMWVEILF